MGLQSQLVLYAVVCFFGGNSDTKKAAKVWFRSHPYAHPQAYEGCDTPYVFDVDVGGILNGFIASTCTCVVVCFLGGNTKCTKLLMDLTMRALVMG